MQGAIIRRVGPLAILAFLLVTCSGCYGLRPRHGLILRGDWSLELNRIPWLAGRGDEYQVPGPVCHSGGTMPAGSGEMCGPQCVGPMCRRCGTRPSGAPTAEPAAATAYHNHPRFHPVPSQPVFEPRADRSAPAAGPTPSVAYPEPAQGAPSGNDATPQKPPPPEEIPTPPPGSRTAAQANASNEKNESPSWIFTGSTDGELEPPPIATQAQKTLKWKRAVR